MQQVPEGKAVGRFQRLIVLALAGIAFGDDAELTGEAGGAGGRQEVRVERFERRRPVVASKIGDGQGREGLGLFARLAFQLDLQQNPSGDLLQQLPEGLRAITGGAAEERRRQQLVR